MPTAIDIENEDYGGRGFTCRDLENHLGNVCSCKPWAAEKYRKASMNPINQFIQIAPDCALQSAIIPPDKEGEKSVAAIEYQLLSAHPYYYTLEALKFAVHAIRKPIPPAELRAHRQQLWDAFFAKPCACMRASPLTKKFGWGVHYDEHGKIAIYAVESQAYRGFVENPNLKKYFALRTKRA